jgi:hypothetical protein
MSVPSSKHQRRDPTTIAHLGYTHVKRGGMAVADHLKDIAARQLKALDFIPRRVQKILALSSSTIRDIESEIANRAVVTGQGRPKNGVIRGSSPRMTVAV